MLMIEIKDKQIIIDGRAQLIMCGEIHYYRLKRETWEDRIERTSRCRGENSI